MVFYPTGFLAYLFASETRFGTGFIVALCLHRYAFGISLYSIIGNTHASHMHETTGQHLNVKSQSGATSALKTLTMSIHPG